MQTSISLSLNTKLKALYSSQNTLPKLIEDEKITALSLDEYYVKLQILLNESDGTDKAALRDKVVGEKKPIEIGNIFKALDVENKIRNLLKKSYQVQEKEIGHIIKPLIEEEKKFELLYKNLPNKSVLEIKNIIELVKRIQADIGKVLLLGSAGIGKTTLMHYLSYKWGRENLWNDKFDYVFRIKLKELLNPSWKDGYSKYFDIDNLSQSKLDCFVHYCLKDNKSSISPREIIDILNKNRVLLLIDGYDEVAHLNTQEEFKNLIDKILEYKNVIMTSRPNAVIEEMSSRFDRKIENTGWDSEGIEKYVNKNFENDKELGVQLKSFLNTHSQIKEICEVPINTALICLVWSDKDIRDKFQKNSNENYNISQLYQEVVIWIAKKYFQKFANENVTNLVDEQILNTPELRFLQESAFEALSDTGKLVTTQLIKAKLNNKDFRLLNIEKINKIGLLKAEGAGKNIIDLNHQFIHLTFQEFLAALHLKNQLQDQEEKSKAATFIAEHRNEPKYLMTLKFLAGIVSNDDKQQVIKIFWEAAICNVDGILELGIERKIILLMHLLAQSEISGEFDSRIPYLKLMQNLVDDTVLQDITSWKQHIIDSGYLSEEIVKVVDEKLKKGKTHFQEFKTAVEIITALANRNEWGNKTKVYEKLVGLLKIEDMNSWKLILQKLTEILDGTIDETVVQKNLKKIISLLGGKIDEKVNIILFQIITLVPNLGKEILNQLQMKSKITIIKSIIYIITKIPPQKAIIFLKNLPINPNYKIKITTTYSLFFLITEMSIQEAHSKLEELLVNPDRETRCTIAGSSPNIIIKMPSLAPQIIAFLKEEIINPNPDPECNIKHIAIESITKIAKILPNLVQETFNLLKKVTVNPGIEYKAKSKAAESLAEIVKMEPNLAQEVFIFLELLIIKSNDEHEIKAKAIESIVEMLEVVPRLAQKAFIFLKEIITNLKFSYDVKISAIENIVAILEIKPSLAQETFSFLKLVIIDFNINHNAKPKAIESITGILKIKPSLAQEAFTFLKVLTMNPKTNIYIKTKAIENMTEILEVIPSLAYETFTLLKVEILDLNANYNIESVVKSISKIVKLKPTQEAFSFLKAAIMNSKTDESIKAKAIESITEIIKSIPTLAYKAFTFLKEVIMNSDADYYIKYKAIESILKIATGVPNLLSEAFIFLKLVSISPDVKLNVKSDAIYTIGKLVEVKPNLTQEVLTFLKETLIDSKGKVNYVTALSQTKVLELSHFDELSYILVNELLKIIGLNKIQNFDKELYIYI